MTITSAAARRRLLLGAALLAVGALPACATGGAASPGTMAAPSPEPAAAPRQRRIEPALARATLDSAWSRIANTYYDTTFRGVDWDAVHAELAPVADTTTTVAGLRMLIGDMLGRLGESHLTLIPGEAVPDPSAARADEGGSGRSGGYSGVRLRLVDGQILVTWVDDDSPAQRAGIRTGWRLVRAGSDTVAALLARIRAMPEGRPRRDAELQVVTRLQARLRDGGPGDTVHAVFAGADELEWPAAIVLGRPPGELVQFGNLPPMSVTVEHRRFEIPGGCASYVHLSVWMPVAMPAVERALDADSACTGLVLDLRGNPGGVAGMAMRMGGLLLDEPIHLGIMQTRTATLRFAVNPRRVRAGGEPAAPFAGKVAILVDEFSMSTSEIVAASLQDVGRARVFGVPTTGQALPSGMVRLPSGDVLLHAYADYHTPSGQRVEGHGVVPDEIAPLTRADLLAGRDAPLDAALRWIAASPPTGP